MPAIRTLFTHVNVATMQTGGAPYGMIEDGAVVLTGDRIDWVGRAADAPDLPATDLDGRLMTPGLIDCHTHLVYGGDRAMEFEMRLEGATYEEVARAGGGIVSTVAATREANVDDLLAAALPRADALIAEGVTTLEIKSGYGLNEETELNMLRAARRIGEARDVEVRTSYLGAHATPPEYKGRDDAYIDEVAIPTLHAAKAAGLADAVDGFCEGIAFTPAQIARVFDVADTLGLPLKLHAEQLSDLGGAKLAASRGALSCDHVEYLSQDGVEAMAAAGTVAVVLPGAFFALRETQKPPIGAFRAAGVPIAVATDANPGSSPLTSLLMAMNMACTLFRLTPEEALAGATRVAAQALGLPDRGVIAPGKRADLAIWDVKRPGELSYRMGFNPLHRRIFGGV